MVPTRPVICARCGTNGLTRETAVAVAPSPPKYWCVTCARAHPWPMHPPGGKIPCDDR
jgi:hypothetical protein